MEITVKSKYLKSAAQKVRPVLFSMRGQNPAEVLNKVKFINKKGASFVAEILKSGLAAAKESDLDTEKLSIKSIFVTEGPKLKRRQIGSRGRSDPIIKRMCHLSLTITDERSKEQETRSKVQTKTQIKKIKETKIKTKLEAKE